MRSFLNDRSNEYRNRSSSRYMETVHKRAGEMRPMLQIYMIEPPPEADIGDVPIVAVSIYWPGHAPDKFYAMTTSLKAPVPPPPRKAFYDAVEAVLQEWNFPMATKRLRNTVMERLGSSCTVSFFDEHIAKIPPGKKYEPVPKRKAYMTAGWGGEAGVEARFDAELLRRAIEILQKDTAEHKSEDVFTKMLEDEKLGDFFSAAYPKDKTRSNGLFTDQVLAENGIAKKCGRPITWLYQG